MGEEGWVQIIASDLYTIEEAPYEQIGPHAFPLILGEEAKFSRNKLVYFLEKNGIDSRSLFLSMPTEKKLCWQHNILLDGKMQINRMSPKRPLQLGRCTDY